MNFKNISAGFSIIEVIVSIFVFGFVLAIFSVSFISFKINKSSKYEVLAYQFAQTEIEALRNYQFDSLTHRADGNFVGLAYNLGQQKIANDALAASFPNVLNISPISPPAEGNLSSAVFLPDSFYNDFTFTVYLKILPSSGDDWRAGIIFRGQDIENYYLFYINPVSMGLAVLEDGTQKFLYTENHIFGAETWHNLKVAAVGDLIQIYLNGDLIAAMNDGIFASGHLGIMGFGTTVFNLDNIHLENASLDNDWHFDDEEIDVFPQGFLKLNPIDLPGGRGNLTVEDYFGGDLKKIIVKMNWLEGDMAREIKLFTLRSRLYE